MEVICFEDKAYYSIIEVVVAKLQEQQKAPLEEKWINTEKAMNLLNIKSKTTLQTLRNEGKIKYSQAQKKLIVYDRHSILDYLEKNSRNTF